VTLAPLRSGCSRVEDAALPKHATVGHAFTVDQLDVGRLVDDVD
jgi:hypothetical protein